MSLQGHHLHTAAMAEVVWLDQQRLEPLVIPYRALSAEALRGVVEAFVLQEGSDYGAREVSLEQKVAQVMRQLERGEAQIVFDASSETVHIVMS